MQVLLTSLSLALALTACQVNVQPSPTPSATPTATPSASPAGPTLDRDFSLRYRQPVTIASEQLQLSFQELIQDSRCPRDVQCIRAGDVTVKLRIVKNGSELGQPELMYGAGDEKAAVVIGGYRVVLVGVSPESKVSTETVAPSDYVLTVRVSKAN